MLALYVVNGGFVVFRVAFKEDLFFVAAIVQNASAQDLDVLRVHSGYTSIDHRAGIQIQSLIAL